MENGTPEGRVYLFFALKISAALAFRIFLNVALRVKSLPTLALDTLTGSDTDNDRVASSSDSFFGFLFAQ